MKRLQLGLLIDLSICIVFDCKDVPAGRLYILGIEYSHEYGRDHPPPLRLVALERGEFSLLPQIDSLITQILEVGWIVT